MVKLWSWVVFLSNKRLTAQTKVPFLGDIPYIGRLFRKDIKSDNKRELLIFVTPRIVNDSVSRNH